MKSWTPKIVFVVMTLLPVMLIAGVAFLGKSSPLIGHELNDANFLQSSENTTEVIFFGYVGCKYICPNSLFRLGEVLDELRSVYPNEKFGGFFIDVNANTQIARANEYGKHFSEEIVGKNVTIEELNALRAQFGLNIFDTGREADDLGHTDHFFIVEKHQVSWKIEKVLSNGISKEDLKTAIESAILNN